MTTEVATGLPAITHADVEAVSRNDPAWLRDRREAAWRLYESMELPDPGDEQWRRTDVREMDFSRVRATASPAGPVVTGGAAEAARLRERGVVVTDLQTAAREHPELMQRYLASAVPADEWKYVALNAALWTGGALVYVPRGAVVDEPIALATSMAEVGAAAFPRTVIIAERESSVRVLDETRSPDGATSFVSGAVEIYAGDGAQVEYYSVNGWGRGVHNFNTVRAILGRDARFLAVAAGIGSSVTKMRIDTVMPEAGARAQLLGVTFGDGEQHFDYNTLQDHQGKHTSSDLQFKSALTDSASLVWYGVTHIRHSAGGSDANQTSRNMLLSEHAKAAPIPILEIEAYDVSKCSHGATVGPVDENELFYLQSRAIPRETAEQMLVEGFFADVIDRVPDARVRERVMEAALAKVGGRLDALSIDEVMAS